MQLSRYIKIYPYEEKADYFLIYSTKKASVILLKEESFQSIGKRNIPEIDETMLSKVGIIVPDRDAEKEFMYGLTDRLNSNDSGLNITVVLNLDCNFDCVYCYEGNMKDKAYMTEKTTELLVDFVKDRFTGNKKSLNIDFYGGEPLLSTGLIKSISRKMKAFTESRGASYTFTIVTNGSLLKRQIAKELSLLGLQSVKITIDGPAEIHNICRPFKSGAGSFDTIINNIKDTCDIVKIGIGGNFQRDNYEKFPLLMDYLETEGLTPDNIFTVKFDPVIKSSGGNTSLPDYVEGCMTINEPWLWKASVLLREEILRRGYNTPKLLPMPCQIEITDYYVVNFDGTIYKCPALIGKKNFEIGNLQDGLKDYRDSYKLGIWKNDDCLECEYLPLCFGGCRYMTYLRDGTIDNIDCKRPYFDATLETLIKQDIKYRSKPKDH
jgi:uncharacterized protein